MISERRKAGLVPATYFTVEISGFPAITCRILGDLPSYIFRQNPVSCTRPGPPVHPSPQGIPGCSLRPPLPERIRDLGPGPLQQFPVVRDIEALCIPCRVHPVRAGIPHHIPDLHARCNLGTPLLPVRIHRSAFNAAVGIREPADPPADGHLLYGCGREPLQPRSGISRSPRSHSPSSSAIVAALPMTASISPCIVRIYSGVSCLRAAMPRTFTLPSESLP